MRIPEAQQKSIDPSNDLLIATRGLINTTTFPEGKNISNIQDILSQILASIRTQSPRHHCANREGAVTFSDITLETVQQSQVVEDTGRN